MALKIQHLTARVSYVRKVGESEEALVVSLDVAENSFTALYQGAGKENSRRVTGCKPKEWELCGPIPRGAL